MVVPRRLSNGRSPPVNHQRQITSFFSTPSSSPSSHPNQNHDSLTKIERSPTPIAPTLPPSHTSSPLSPPVFTPTHSSIIPTTPASSHGAEVVGNRVKIYWPLDRTWYEGRVESFDQGSGSHLVFYNDGEQEMLDLSKEKVEWVDKAHGRACSRLRRISRLDDFEEKESSDEEWGLDEGGEDIDDDDNVEVDLEEEEGDPNGEDVSIKCNFVKKFGSKKRQIDDLGLGSYSTKKIKVLEKSDSIRDNGLCFQFPQNDVSGDIWERFGPREVEKFRFLNDERRDGGGRSPGDANYDPKTLYLPPTFLKSLSGGQRQWWGFKSKHMDKVIFFKMGKFYELFEMDAHIGAKELDLQYMKGEQPHCGFPEKNFSLYSEKLARKGYRVLVVEQTETPEQLEIRRKKMGSTDKVVKREVCAVVTKGTLTEGDMLTSYPDASYLMSITESGPVSGCQKEGRVFGACVVDVAANRICLGQFCDDLECTTLSFLLNEMRPVEIIKPSNMLSSDTEKVIVKCTRNPLVNELVPVVDFWDAEKTVSELMKSFKRDYTHATSDCLNKPNLSENGAPVKPSLPRVLTDFVNAGVNGIHALSALGGILSYLRNTYMDETLLRYGNFEQLPVSGFTDVAQKSCMVLDSAALENLEIFENSKNGNSEGTLYAHLNHCVTAFGKRLLKLWLARPLFDLESIKKRQDAVNCLGGINLHSALDFRKELSKLPDMERLLARLFSNSESNGRNSNRVVLYEDAAKKQLEEFILALRGFEKMVEACSSLREALNDTESELLLYLLVPGKGFPDVESIINHFKNAFDWVEAGTSGRIVPCDGVDMDYDSACKKVKSVKCNLSNHLKEQRKLLGDISINYVSVGKDAYLLEVTEALQSSVPQGYELRSSRKGFHRYWNPHIKRMLQDLSDAESDKETKSKSILHNLVISFCTHHDKWRQLIAVISEIDVLSSMGVASNNYTDGPTCRPIITSLMNSDVVPHCIAKGLGHPILGNGAEGNGTFVPNDVAFGGTQNAPFILLTGPNMGGKSTLLRQICLAVILAQMGANVPAESFELSLVDRIFVRMGAKDHIMTGQSTFLTELSETASVLVSATSNSLVALDELGRGTSTSDGQAIAESVLHHLVHEVNCRGLFSTHYHRLAMIYEGDPKVSLHHMECQVRTTVDGVEEVTFLYKLMQGACPKSYGVNVARLAGLPESLLKAAAAKSKEIEAVNVRRMVCEDGLLHNNTIWEVELSTFLKQLHKATLNFKLTSAYVCDLQLQAGLLFEQNRT